MTTLYAMDVFLKALNNSIYAKFKAGFPSGVNAFSGDKTTSSHNVFISGLRFISNGLQSARIPKLQHGIPWGLFDLHYFLPHLNFISKPIHFRELVSALVQVPPPFNQCLDNTVR